jgi:hypothetical protein
MDITFMQRWRKHIVIAFIPPFLIWLLMRDNADYMHNAFPYWFYLTAAWLWWSLCWCAMAQFLFRRNIKRILELQRQVQRGEFSGTGNWK